MTVRLRVAARAARRAAPLLLGTIVAACGHSTIQQPNNASTNDAINAISANMTDHDGKGVTTVPSDADAVGQSMRAAGCDPAAEALMRRGNAPLS